MSASKVILKENEAHIDTLPEQSTGLSLSEYISILLEVKTTLIICVLFLAILSILTFFFLPLKSQASLVVTKTPKVVSIQYDSLNKTITELNEFNIEINASFAELRFPTDPKLEKDHEEVEEKISFSIDNDTLIVSLFEQLLKREPFFQAIRDNKLLKPNNYADDREYENAIIENAYEVKLLPPTKIIDGVPVNQKNFRPYWIIEHEARNEDALRNVIFDALHIATKSVKKDLVVEFNQIVEEESIRRKVLIDRIEQFIQLKVSEYDLEMNSHLAVLTEQAELARVLGIEKNALEVRSLSANNQILALEVENDETSQKLFYRGYKVLDREIKQIEERKNVLNFIEDIVPLKTLKLKLEQDKTLKQLQSIFNSTPLVAGDFQTASYHKYGILITKPSTRYMVPIFIFIFGLFLIICILVVRRLIELE